MHYLIKSLFFFAGRISPPMATDLRSSCASPTLTAMVCVTARSWVSSPPSTIWRPFADSWWSTIWIHGPLPSCSTEVFWAMPTAIQVCSSSSSNNCLHVYMIMPYTNLRSLYLYNLFFRCRHLWSNGTHVQLSTPTKLSMLIPYTTQMWGKRLCFCSRLFWLYINSRVHCCLRLFESKPDQLISSSLLSVWLITCFGVNYLPCSWFLQETLNMLLFVPCGRIWTILLNRPRSWHWQNT